MKKTFSSFPNIFYKQLQDVLGTKLNFLNSKKNLKESCDKVHQIVIIGNKMDLIKDGNPTFVNQTVVEALAKVWNKCLLKIFPF